MPRTRRALALALLGGLLACIVAPRERRAADIEAALADLARVGFAFEADVRFRYDRWAVCEGFACADLLVIRERRTVVIAEGAFESASRLRASLLEIWERYRAPRPGSLPDLARGALRVVRDGRRAGVSEVQTLQLAHHTYRQLWTQLEADARRGLPPPDALAFP